MKLRVTPARCLAMALCASSFLSSARADTIILKNGSRIDGKIERKEEGPMCPACKGRGDITCEACAGRGMIGARPCPHCNATGRVECRECGGRGRGEMSYVIRLRGGVRTTIRESQVEEIRYSEVAPEDLLPTRESYKARVEKLGGDAEDELELAQWCLDHGLLAEALRHATHAASELPEIAVDARRVASAAEGRLVAIASKGFVKAFALVRSLKLDEGAEALEAALQEHAANPLLATPAREREFLGENAADLVKEYGSTLAQIAEAVARKARTACRVCHGAGSTLCPVCKGASEGICPRCRGSGQSWCPDCNGTNWRLCITCGGAGRITSSTIGTASTCPECRGRGVVPCKRCRGGRTPCPTCGGKGRIEGGCETCGGDGRIECEACLGTGQRQVEKLLWGPVGEFVEREHEGDRSPIYAWQGIRRGCIITLLREIDIYGGAYASHLAAATGKRREVLLACIDNRDGRDQVVFAPGQQGLRLVTRDARQVESVLPRLGGDATSKPAYVRMFALLSPTAVLPGVLRNVIATFPDGTDFDGVTAIYWGRDEPWRLTRFTITPEDLAEILKSIH